MCINVMLKVKVGSAVSLVQAVGGGTSMPDHVQAHTYSTSTQDGGYSTPVSYTLKKTRAGRQLKEVGNTRTVNAHRSPHSYKVATPNLNRNVW